MRGVGTVVALTAVMAGGTVWWGWWALPGLGFAAGLLLPGRGGSAGASALAAILAWAALLALAARSAAMGEVVGLTAGVLGVPAPVVYLIALVFAALVAGAAATLGQAIRNASPRPRPRPRPRAPARS